MLVVLYFFILFLNVFFAIRKKQSKIVALISSVYILVLFVGSQGTVDLDNYLDSYLFSNKNLSQGIQVTYTTLQTFFLEHEYGFYSFRFFLTFISLVGLYVFAVKFFACTNLIYAMYMLYLFVMDDIQLRNFSACTFLYLGMLVLFSNIKMKKTIFSLFVVFASTIHVAFLAYLLFLLVPFDESKRYAIKIGVVFFVLSIFFLFFRDYLSVVSDVLIAIDSRRGEGYSLIASNFGGAYFIFIQFATTLYFFIAYYRMCKDPVQYRIVYEASMIDVKSAIFLFLNINSIAFAFCSLTIFSTTFYRLLRNMYLINVAGFYMTSLKNKNHYYWIPEILYLLFWLYLDILPEGCFDLFVKPIFTNNFLVEDFF